MKIKGDYDFLLRPFVVLVFLLLNMVLLAACASNVTTPIAQVVATDRPTRMPSQTATNTPLPPTATLAEHTVVPTTPPGPTHTPTSTQTPTLTPTPTHTIHKTFISPDEKWIATVEKQFIEWSEGEEVEDVYLRVRNVEEGFEWIVELYRVRGWTASLPWPLFWSPDGQSLYFTHTVFSDGCFSSGPYSDFLRFDLYTGETLEIIPRGVASDYILSPDGIKVAIILKDGAVRIFEFASGNMGDVSFPFLREFNDVNLNIVWSPDSRMIMAQASFDACYLIPLTSSSIYRVNVETLEQTLLLDSGETPTFWYSLIGWPEANLVLLVNNGEKSYMNPWTGAISPIVESTETP